ncbi:MAG TPA: hypothetical protein VNZ49_13260 [Bacteroidia bacterium]|nr:hypothetical protein [Bacteroidia bacterium]
MKQDFNTQIKDFRQKITVYYDIADPRRGWTYNGNSAPPSSGKTIYTYNCLDVPLKLVCLVGKNRIRLTGSVGMLLSGMYRPREYFTGKDSNGVPVSKTIIKSGYVTPMLFSPVISAGIDYRLNEYMFLKIEPIVRYSLRGISQPCRPLAFICGTRESILPII